MAQGRVGTRTAMPRWLNFGFAAFSVLNVFLIYPRENAVLPLIQGIGAVGYSIAAVVSLLCGLWSHRPVARRVAIGFHLSFIVPQFIFSFPGPAPLAGMIFSVVTVVLLRPVFPNLSPGKRKFWVTLHVGLSVGWLGIAASMIVLSMVGVTTDDPGLRHGVYQAMHIFDLVIVIPSVLLSIITGLVVSLCGKWGLVKNWWVLIKFIISLIIPGFAALESQWVMGLASKTADPTFDPGGTGVALAVCMFVFAALLWTATVLSVFKPGGKTRWGRRAAERDRAQRIARQREPVA